MTGKHSTLEKIKKSLRKANPGWSEERITSAAIATMKKKGLKTVISEDIILKEATEGEDKEYYVEGYITSNRPDRSNEVVTDEAIKSIVEQINTGNIKIDREHEKFKDRTNTNPPLGRLIEAKEEIVEGVKKIWVKAQLNKNYPDFTDRLNEIKNKFLSSFSITFKNPKPGEFIEKMVEGSMRTFYTKVNLLNVAIVGNPDSYDSDIVQLTHKSIGGYFEDNNLHDKMAEKEETKEASEDGVKIKELGAEVAKLKTSIEEKNAVIKEFTVFKDETETKLKDAEDKLEHFEELEGKFKEMTEKVKAQSKDITGILEKSDYKALVKTWEASAEHMKSLTGKKPESETEHKTPMGYK